VPLTITDLANNRDTTSSATLVTGATVTANAGDWLVAIVAADNAGAAGISSISSVQDSAGNGWTQRALINRTAANATNDGASLGIFTGQVINAPSGGTVTANFSPNTTSKAIEVYRVQPGAGEAVQFVAADAAGLTGSTTTHNANIVSVSSGDTIFGAAAIESNLVLTADSDTTNGSWSSLIRRLADTTIDATSMQCASQWKTVTGSGNQDWAVTTAAGKDSARSYLILRAALIPSTLIFNPNPMLPLLVR
jgi:hypothetical protein